METRNDISNLLAMYIRNTREIYDITTWLQNCVIKKANKGIQPQVECLANCSTMKTIIREAAKLLYKYDGITPTRQEKQQAAKEHANDYKTLNPKDVPSCITIDRRRSERYFSVYIEKFGNVRFDEVLRVFPLLPKAYLNE